MRAVGTVDVLAEPTSDDAVDLLLVGIGAMATTAMAAAEKLSAQGVRVRVVDPRWCLPVSDDLVGLARLGRRRRGPRGQRRRRRRRIAGLGARCARRGCRVPVHLHGIPKRFLDHASRGQVLEEIGLTPDAVADQLHAALT